MTTTTTATIQDLIAFVYDNPGVTGSDVAKEFSIDTTDAEEILASLDDNDGTISSDGEGYSVEDKEATLKAILSTHTMGGGRKLTEELPYSQPKATPKPKKKPKKATTKATKKTSESPPTEEGEVPVKKKRGRKKAAKPEATEVVGDSTPPEPKVKAPRKPRVVTARASRIVDEAEAQTLGITAGTEVKLCVDCRGTYPKFGGMFRPRWRDPDAQNEINPTAKANAKHVQPRCIDCDKLRSRRKSRFTGLRRVIGVEDIGIPDAIVTHPDRKAGGVPDGKFSVALINDMVDGFTPNLRGVMVNMAESLIKLRWASGDNPEIVGATQKAIKASKAAKPTIVIPTPKPSKKAEPVVEVEETPPEPTEEKPKAKATKKSKKKNAKPKAEPKAKKKKKDEEDTTDLDW